MSMNDGGGMLELAFLFFFVIVAIFGIGVLWGIYKTVRWLDNRLRKTKKPSNIG